jgi:hypothetical protein
MTDGRFNANAAWLALAGGHGRRHDGSSDRG